MPQMKPMIWLMMMMVTLMMIMMTIIMNFFMETKLINQSKSMKIKVIKWKW
uniref:ATP synthase F0 subunit 8 n=1 Tax=Andrena cineraria TaxID=465493 RepID=A0A0S2LSR3_ANDCI|nr:ATP synthase F0 subunit 8 [Andrena cineraria]